MNRKQKVAVVVGVVVIVLLVLFPPWIIHVDMLSDMEPWHIKHGPAWIGSPPRSPFAECCTSCPTTRALPMPQREYAPGSATRRLTGSRGYRISSPPSPSSSPPCSC